MEGVPSKSIIAKNTVFLYFRMLFVMGVTLYTSRVILETLGIVDFGIYQTVGGIVGMLTFINSALSTGNSRFITFELGKNDPQKLRRTFVTTVNIQLLLCVFVLIVAETIGVWFVKKKLLIPPETLGPALWAYHLSIITTIFNLISVPYIASIISHEKMNVFAYIGIIEVCAKLSIVYLLNLSTIDKLILYAILLLIVQILITLFYYIYCITHFSETHYQAILDRSIFKGIASFSGWSLFAASSRALNNQGILVVLNMFFSPAIVTARALSLQVNNAANQFVSNFRTAVNPQIIKQYALGNYSESKKLLLTSTKFSFYLMLLLSLPICIGAENLLNLWLKEVPNYTVIFLQLVIIQSLFQVFDTSFYTALYAKGDLKANALISPTLGFIMFPTVYFLFKAGFSPVTLSWASLILYAILGLIIKPYLIIRIVNYSWNEILSVYKPCCTVSVISGILSYFIASLIHYKGLIGFMLTTMICWAISIPAIYYLGVSVKFRIKLKKQIISKLNLSRKTKSN